MKSNTLFTIFNCVDLDLNKIDENEKTNQKKLWSIFLDKYLFGGTNKQ